MGGLVLLGKSPINEFHYNTRYFINSWNRVNPCEKDVEGSGGDTMGGEIPTDSSGTLKYEYNTQDMKFSW